ncbi:Ammonium transporter, partial [Nowakowskiella sp. JEL0078]
MSGSPVAPTWLNNGDNAWQLTAATLVGLQSVPGLMVLYAGVVKKKWAINSAFMGFYAFAAVLICWVTWAYSMSFGPQWGSATFIGQPATVLGIGVELQQATIPAANLTMAYPLSTMIYFQFVFAAITLIIMAGAFLGRMNFIAWMIFVPLWLTISYTVGAFSLWGGGWLFQMGVLDYSGGYVIHLSSGTAGFIGAAIIGPRLPKDRVNFEPNNVLLTLVGAGILWMGWNGFNGGDPYTASPDAGVAVLNTNICTAMSLLVWTILDVITFKKPSVIGAIQGMITGLVAITPAAGFIPGWAAIVMGVISGSIPWVSMNFLGKVWPAFNKVDDCLGVFHTHALAGLLGGIFTGVFATKTGVVAFGDALPGGPMDGYPYQIVLQIIGAAFIIALNLVMTPLALYFIKYVLRVPLRMSEEALLAGDEYVHGEDAYAFYGEGQKFLDSSLIMDTIVDTPAEILPL